MGTELGVGYSGRASSMRYGKRLPGRPNLGLSIAYDIITRHHGEIKAESEVGIDKGMIFTIVLPIVTE
jgi:signal transduction histidine kinase